MPTKPKQKQKRHRAKTNNQDIAFRVLFLESHKDLETIYDSLVDIHNSDEDFSVDLENDEVREEDLPLVRFLVGIGMYRFSVASALSLLPIIFDLAKGDEYKHPGYMIARMISYGGDLLAIYTQTYEDNELYTMVVSAKNSPLIKEVFAIEGIEQLFMKKLEEVADTDDAGHFTVSLDEIKSISPSVCELAKKNFEPFERALCNIV